MSKIILNGIEYVGGSGSSGGGSNIDNYSTSEQVVGTWINSKPVYQRTWTGTKTTSTAETVISGLNDIDDLVDSVLIMKASNGAQVAQYYRDWNDFGRCYLDGTVVKMDLGQDWPAKPIDWRITLRYTKTTD